RTPSGRAVGGVRGGSGGGSWVWPVSGSTSTSPVGSRDVFGGRRSAMGPILYRDLRPFTPLQTPVGCPRQGGHGTYEGTLVALEARMRTQLAVITIALVGLAAPSANAAPTLTYGPIISRGATPDKMIIHWGTDNAAANNS